MATGDESAPTLQVRRNSRLEWFAERWDKICPPQEADPNWLRQLATQLELWVADELDDALHLEIGFGPVPEGAGSTAQEPVESNAYNSDVLYLRALTEHYFVAVDVNKASRQAADAEVSVLVIPRARLESLQAIDMKTRGLTPDSVRLSLRYVGVTQSFRIPHEDDYIDAETWRGGEDVRVFNALRGDLWQSSEDKGTAIVIVD
jgi:hypothetical protein